MAWDSGCLNCNPGVTKKREKMKKLLTNKESNGMMSKLRLGNHSGQKITSKKVEKVLDMKLQQ